MSVLTRYHWPGNIRELQNLIERAVILSKNGTLANPLLPTKTLGVASESATTLSEYERSLILHTLETAGWVIGGPKGAAAKLGLPRTSLIAKMQKLGISRPQQHNPEMLDAQA